MAGTGGEPDPRVRFVVEKGRGSGAKDMGGRMRIVERAEDRGREMLPWAAEVLRRQAELRNKRNMPQTPRQTPGCTSRL